MASKVREREGHPSCLNYDMESRGVTGTCPGCQLTTARRPSTVFFMRNFNPKTGLPRHLRRVLTSLLLYPLLTSCSESSAPILTFWEGTLIPVRPSVLGGRVVAVTQHGRTDVGISIEEGESGVKYEWRIDSGTCEQSGVMQGGRASYPPLLPGLSGTASAETTISSLFKPGKQFAARVLRSPDGGSEQIVACGDLEQTG